MDQTAFLTIVITLVSATLIAVGVYLILLLKEARGTFQRTNKILDRAESASLFVEQNLLNSGGNIVSILAVVKEILDLFKRNRRKKVGGDYE